jgi:predicted ribosomally synthesized peptide with SipW-like signal peptide
MFSSASAVPIPSGMNKTRKALVGIIAGGIALTGLGAGTLASFSASTSNGGTFATGSLVLSNQKNTGTACLSTGGGSTDTNSNACDQLFAVSVTKPGQAATVNLTLRNEGSIDAAALASFATSACAAADAAGEAHHGTGNPCGAISVYVQEFSDGARTTPSACHYGGGTATTCAYDAAETLSTFGSTHADAGSALALGATAASTSRYFTVGLQMASSAGNDMQGRQATFGLSWQLVQ